MPTNPNAFSDDQARQLRALRQTQPPVDATVPRMNFYSAPARSTPRFTLLSEEPFGGCIRQLAWLMANRKAQQGVRSLIIDLTPSGSPLPALLERQLAQRDCRPQPLWSVHPSGRGLATWTPMPKSLVDVVAQPASEFPSTEQLGRIYEQLLRRFEIAHAAEQHWQHVFLISDLIGLPLDRACWLAADEIVAFTGPFASQSSLLISTFETALGARLSNQLPKQRRLLLCKQPWHFRNLRFGLRKTRHAHLHPSMLENVEQFIACGLSHYGTKPLDRLWTRKRLWPLQAVASQLTTELDVKPGGLRLRQAS